MRFLKAGAFALALAACAEGPKPEPVREPDAATQRMVSGGSIIGFVEDNTTHVWRAVPYAADTSGENRWRAPRVREAWEGVREATAFGPACPQIATPFTQIPGWTNGQVEGSEDCLTFDIYAPSDARGRNLPVMVWIHGGSNVSGASQLYRGHNLAANEDVIVMSVQYRLGPLGWFSHPDLVASAETERDRSSNFGTLDLIAALEWVQVNASVFGGDPNNVTIFGESAGGHNVATLLASPLAEGLFHRAIIQSGSFDSITIAEAQGEAGDQPNPSLEVADRLGPENFHTASLQEVFAAYELEDGQWMNLPRVFQDGVVLPEGPMREAFSSPETFNNVPILTGTNRDEMKLFYVFNPELTKKVLGQFYAPRDKDLYNAASDYAGRYWRLRAVDRPARAMRDGGHEMVFAYRFDWDEGGRMLWSDTSVLLGAAHTMEIPFVLNRFEFFGALDPVIFNGKTAETREELSRAIGAYWANFARDGYPYADGFVDWPTYGANETLMYLDSANDGGIRTQAGGDSIQQILADLAADGRVNDEQKCAIADSLRDFNGQAEIDPMAALGCPSIPSEE